MGGDDEDFDLEPVRKIRYVFTLVMPLMDGFDNPILQRVWQVEMIGKLEDLFKPERIGIVAIVEGGNGG